MELSFSRASQMVNKLNSAVRNIARFSTPFKSSSFAASRLSQIQSRNMTSVKKLDSEWRAILSPEQVIFINIYSLCRLISLAVPNLTRERH